MNIILKARLDQDFIGELLYYLWNEGETGPTERTTLLGIADGMNIDLQNNDEIEKLRLHLWYLEKEEYLEERIYSKQIGLVDYSLENKAFNKYLEVWRKKANLPPLSDSPIENGNEPLINADFKEIIFKTELDDALIERLLNYFSKEHEKFDETSFLTIAKEMNVDTLKNNELEKLRLHLVYLEKEGFIKERGYVGPEELIYLYYALEPKALTLYSENWRVKNTFPLIVKE